jgi:hypothetical protein
MRNSLLLFHSACAYALWQFMDTSPRKPPLRTRWLSGVLIALLFSLPARAQPSPPTSLPVQPATGAPETSDNNQTPPSGEIDVNGGYSFDGHQDYSGPSVHGSFSPRNSFNRWNAGVARVQQFGITGQTFEAGIDRDLTNTWGGSKYQRLKCLVSATTCC